MIFSLSGSRDVTLAAPFLMTENRIMVMILSTGCSIRIAASIAVRPRLMPCPSMDTLGGRYCSLRLRPLLTPVQISKPIKPKQMRPGRKDMQALKNPVDRSYDTCAACDQSSRGRRRGRCPFRYVLGREGSPEYVFGMRVGIRVIPAINDAVLRI